MNNLYFLGFWAEIKNDIGIAVDGMIRGIFYAICSAIYKMIYYFYNIFEVLCNGQLLETEQLNRLFGRVSLLLGVIMLFRVAFTFIQAIVDPDSGLNDKEKGIPNLLKKVIIVIIMFGISGYVFDLASDVQALIIKNHVISKFLLPKEVNSENFGGVLAANLFTTFYNIDPEVDASSFSGEDAECVSEEYINTLRYEIAEKNDFSYKKNQCIKVTGVYKDSDKEDVYVIEFNYIFCLIVGIFVLWFLINYCISAGVRVAQLTVLQLLAPVAFVGYLEPKSDNMFKKWLDRYISTYIDVFIRIGIISFVCYICALIMEGWNDGSGVFWKSVGNPTGFTAKVIGIFMILALFQFAKSAPKLLGEILPKGSSGLSFGTNKESFKPLGYGKMAAGAVAGAATYGTMSAVSRFRDQRKLNESKGPGAAALAALGGFGSGMVRGIGAGGKKGNVFSNLRTGFSKQVEADDAYRDLVASGGSRTGQLLAAAANAVGTDKGTKNATIIERSKRISEALKAINDAAEQSTGYKQFMDRKKAIQLNTNLSEDEKIEQMRDVQKEADDWKKKYVKHSFDGSIQNMDDIGGIAVSGGDKVRSNGMRNDYIDIKAEVDQINPELMNEDGTTYKVTMKDVKEVTYDEFDGYLKDAQRSESNVKAQPQYRQNEANRPKRGNN